MYEIHLRKQSLMIDTSLHEAILLACIWSLLADVLEIIFSYTQSQTQFFVKEYNPYFQSLGSK